MCHVAVAATAKNPSARRNQWGVQSMDQLAWTEPKWIRQKAGRNAETEQAAGASERTKGPPFKLKGKTRANEAIDIFIRPDRGSDSYIVLGGQCLRSRECIGFLLTNWAHRGVLRGVT